MDFIGFVRGNATVVLASGQMATEAVALAPETGN